MGNLGEMICKSCGCWRSTVIKTACPKLQKKYNELIMAVGNKYPNETRHETALRYIQQAERTNNQPCQARR
jgi:hypothetical protein